MAKPDTDSELQPIVKPNVNTVDEDNYFIACATCREMKDVHGTVMTKEGTVVWLAYDDGYAQCTLDRRFAAHFTSPGQIARSWHNWDGMPWYYRLQPDSVRIVHVITTTQVDHSEMEIDVPDGSTTSDRTAGAEA